MKLVLLLSIYISNIFASHHEHKHSEHDHNWMMDKAAFNTVKEFKIPSLWGQKKLIQKKLLDSVIDIDPDEFMEKLRMFSGAIEVEPGVRLTSRCKLKELTPTVEFLKREYQALGYDAEAVPVGRRYLNFVAKKPGVSKNPKVIVISSHIDSVCNAGANDNGSGTISALMIAKAIKDMSFEHTIYFVGFDNEESGMAGSKSFADKMKKTYGENFMANINLEMMATNSRKDKVFHVIDCERPDSNYLTEVIANNISAHGLGLKINEACTNRSDHASFWKKGLPAVVISENFFGGDSDRCYHKRCDVVDSRMDPEYMSLITKALGYSVMELAVKQ